LANCADTPRRERIASSAVGCFLIPGLARRTSSLGDGIPLEVTVLVLFGGIPN